MTHNKYSYLQLLECKKKKKMDLRIHLNFFEPSRPMFISPEQTKNILCTFTKDDTFPLSKFTLEKDVLTIYYEEWFFPLKMTFAMSSKYPCSRYEISLRRLFLGLFLRR